MRTYRTFSYKEANFRIASDHFEIITGELVRQRTLLDSYIRRYPSFLHSFEPLRLEPDAPPIAGVMAEAGQTTGTGPMAAVAGAMAEAGARAALEAGAEEAIVENGGDIFLSSRSEVFVGLYPGNSPLAGKLALRVDPGDMPLALCSSSSRMGHSTSFGNCDLVTVAAGNAALADAAATRICNLVRGKDDIEPALAHLDKIKDILGILIVQGGHIGKTGWLPELVKNADPSMQNKVTRDRRSRSW